MKIATTTCEVNGFADSAASAVRYYRNTGFRFLDYSFYHVLTLPNHPFLGDRWKDEIREAKAAAEEEGIAFVQAHAPACKIMGAGKEDGLNACLRAIEACGILGIPNAVIHSSFAEGSFRYPLDKEAYFEANRPFFRALIPAMETFGVGILLENSCEVNTRGSYFPMTAKDLNEMIAFLDHPLFGACWDVGHGHIQGLDHGKEMVELGNNLKAVHIHDNNGQRDQHLPPFAGTLDFDRVLQGILDSGFKGPFALEVDGYLCYRKNHAETPLSNAPNEVKRASLAYLYQTAKGMLEAYGIQGE